MPSDTVLVTGAAGLLGSGIAKRLRAEGVPVVATGRAHRDDVLSCDVTDAAAVEQAVIETGAAGPKDMGKVMKAVMAALSGRTADGKKVNEAVRTRLSR